MLTLNQVSLQLGRRYCLEDICLSLPLQGISMVVGANGAGKTLLLKLCAGLLAPTSGSLSNDKTLPSSKVGWVPQTPILLDRTVLQNILLPLRYQSFAKPLERAEKALQWAKIESLASTRATTLSTGQQQLVALARAWALHPRLLLLDEPCANLDPYRQQQVETLIQQLSEAGCLVIMSSHHLPQVKRLADEVIFLEAGKLITQMTTTDFFITDTITTEQHAEVRVDTNHAIYEKIRWFIQYA